MSARAGLVATLAAALALAGCERERRESPIAPEVARAVGVPADTIRPGGAPPLGGERHAVHAEDLGGRAYDLSEGKRLYESFNCVGCHAHGGGAIGPALMDSRWIYGSDPRQIYETIAQGRPNGMPAFGGKIPDHEIWQLVAYVRSLSGLAPKDAAPVRDDHMQVRPSESLTPAERPVQGAR